MSAMENFSAPMQFQFFSPPAQNSVPKLRSMAYGSGFHRTHRNSGAKENEEVSFGGVPSPKPIV